MAMTITFKNEPILQCSNAIYGTLFRKISEIIEDQNIDLNKNLNKIYEKLELCDYGYTMDFEDHIENREAMLQFLSILFTAIKKFKKDYPGLIPAAEKKLWNFYHSLERAVAEEHK